MMKTVLAAGLLSFFVSGLCAAEPQFGAEVNLKGFSSVKTEKIMPAAPETASVALAAGEFGDKDYDAWKAKMAALAAAGKQPGYPVFLTPGTMTGGKFSIRLRNLSDIANCSGESRIEAWESAVRRLKAQTDWYESMKVEGAAEQIGKEAAALAEVVCSLKATASTPRGQAALSDLARGANLAMPMLVDIQTLAGVQVKKCKIEVK